MVTGAGGSIGSGIVRQMRLLGAGKVFDVDNDECALYNLQMGEEGVALLDDDTYRADVRDEQFMRRIMQEVQPDIVFHAAAHKHLPLLERAPEAAVKTNLFGTESVILAAIAAKVDRVVNVLGSRGSFLPTLITHITYVLDMGSPVRIEAPVSRYVELAGCRPPKIEYTGLRPGEKLSEDLFDLRETYYSTAHPRILRILKVEVGYYPIDETLAFLRQLVRHGAHPAIVRTALEFNIDRNVHNGLDRDFSGAAAARTGSID